MHKPQSGELSQASSSIAEDKARVQQIRKLVTIQFEKRAQGAALGGLLSHWTDQFLLNLANEAFRDYQLKHTELDSDVALIAVGGYGRAELAPYSDIDLLFLYRNSKANWFEAVAASIVRRGWDSGLKLGHSLRRLNEALAMARDDVQIATSLVETRLIWGSQSLHDDLRFRFTRSIGNSRNHQFYHDCIRSRELERDEHGQSAQFLEPDVKRSAGGLRDIHLIRWIAFSIAQESKLDIIWKQGLLNQNEFETLRGAYEFLMRNRFYLHLHAGRGQDVLSRHEQLRIADQLGYLSTSVQQPVEQFMQKYFLHAIAVREITERFVERNRPGRWISRVLSSLLTRRYERIFLIRPSEIDVIASHRLEVARSLEKTMKLFELAAKYGSVPNPILLDEIQQYQPEEVEDVTPAASQSFLYILSHPRNIGKIMRSMYSCGALERLLPAMRHCRGLLQFNQYHSYTVDEHTMRAIEAAGAFAADMEHAGKVFRSLKSKELLFLAVLLHDMAKGYEEDHSILGARFAIDVGQRLLLQQEPIEILSFLVRWHLHMSDLALRRDISDPKLTSTFAHLVGDSRRLRLLYLLTIADIQAVGPGVWTQWKGELLKDIYDRTLEHFGEESETPKLAAISETQVIESLMGAREMQPWSEGKREQVSEIFRSLPSQYLQANLRPTIEHDILSIVQLGSEESRVTGRYDDDSGLVEFLVIGRHGFTRGIFERICGVLTAMRLKIVAAAIATTSQGVIIDRFRLLDQDFPNKPPVWRIEEISGIINEHLYRPTSLEKLFKKNKRYGNLDYVIPLAELPLRVVPDQDSSDAYTILDIFAHDRPGLLLTITRAINEFGMSIVMAKIATHFDQVVDVFYIVDEKGEKITDQFKLNKLVTTIETRLREFEERGYKLFQ